MKEFSTSLQEDIINNFDSNISMPQYEFVYSDKSCLEGKSQVYNEWPKEGVCAKCDYKNICSKIELAYKVLQYRTGKWFNSLE